MANYAKIPGDLVSVKSKSFFGLTKRQLIGVTLGLIVGLPVFFGIKKSADITVAGFISFLISGPFFASGFFNIQGMPLAKYLKYVLKNKCTPKIRVYKTKNEWEIKNINNKRGEKNGEKRNKKKTTSKQKNK